MSKTIRNAKTVKTASASAIKFTLETGARPTAGARLMAFTAAWLDLSGLIDGGSIPKAQAVKIAGARAIQYHIQTGNLKADDSGVSVTEKGFAYFMQRTTETADRDAYASVMQTGKPVDGYANNPLFIKAV